MTTPGSPSGEERSCVSCRTTFTGEGEHCPSCRPTQTLDREASPAPPTSAPEIPGFRILRKLGIGGMGVVY